MFIELCVSSSVLATVRHPSSPFPPPGPRGSGSPASSVLRLAPTPRPPSRGRPSFPSGGDTTLRPLTLQARWTRLACAVFGRSASACSRGEVEASRVPGESTTCMPRSLTPARPALQVFAEVRCCLPEMIRRRPSRAICLEARSHGLHASLSTLRSRGRPRTTQDSLPVGDQPCPGGDRYPQDSTEGFRVRSSFSFSRLPWRTSPPHSVVEAK